MADDKDKATTTPPSGGEPAKEVVKKTAISSMVDIALPLALDFLVFFGAPAAFRAITGKKGGSKAQLAPLEAIQKEWKEGKKESAIQKLETFITSIAPEFTLNDEGLLRRDVMRGVRAGLYTLDEGLNFIDWLDRLPEWQHDNFREDHLNETDGDVRVTELAEIIKMSDTERTRLFKGTNLFEKTSAQRSDEEVKRKGKVLDRAIGRKMKELQSGASRGSFGERLINAFRFKLFH